MLNNILWVFSVTVVTMSSRSLSCLRCSGPHGLRCLTTGFKTLLISFQKSISEIIFVRSNSPENRDHMTTVVHWLHNILWLIFTFTDSLTLPTFLRVLSVCTVSLSIISRRHWSLSVITDEEVSEYLPSGTSLFSKQVHFQRPKTKFCFNKSSCWWRQTRLSSSFRSTDSLRRCTDPISPHHLTLLTLLLTCPHFPP